MRGTICKRWLRFFNSRHWALRYVMIIGVVYVPAIMIAGHSGKLSCGADAECGSCLFNDYAFNCIWMFFVPLSLVMLPWVYKEIESALEQLTECRPPVIDDSMMNGRCWFENKVFQYWLSVVGGLMIVSVIGVTNVMPYVRGEDEKGGWWFPTDESYAPWVYVLFISFAGTAIVLLFLIRYLCVIRLIRRGVRKMADVPTWIANSPGPMNKLFRAVFLFLLPSCIMCMLIAYARIVTGQLSLFVTVLNIVIIPVMVVVIFVVPIIFSGVPSRFHMQRRRLLQDSNEGIAKVFSQLGSGLAQGDIKSLVDELEMWSRQKELVMKNYPRWAVGFSTSMISSVPVGISILSSVISVVRRLWIAK